MNIHKQQQTLFISATNNQSAGQKTNNTNTQLRINDFSFFCNMGQDCPYNSSKHTQDIK